MLREGTIASFEPDDSAFSGVGRDGAEARRLMVHRRKDSLDLERRNPALRADSGRKEGF